MSAKNSPRVGAVYSLGYIYTELVLEGEPSLLFKHQERDGVLVHEHVDVGDISAVPGLFYTCWEYLDTASAISPVFLYHGDFQQLFSCIDISPLGGAIERDPEVMWRATPKGHPYPYKNPL